MIYFIYLYTKCKLYQSIDIPSINSIYINKDKIGIIIQSNSQIKKFCYIYKFRKSLIDL